MPGAKSRGFTKLHTGLEGLTLQAVPRRTSLGDRASLVAWRVWHLGGGRERERPGKGGGGHWIMEDPVAMRSGRLTGVPAGVDWGRAQRL